MDRADMARIKGQFVASTEMAARCGFDMLEIHAAHGYLLSSFITPLTNHRTDEWGGDLVGRARLALEIVRQTRAAVGPNFIIIFRISGLDLVEGGGTGAEVEWLASQMEGAGATMLNTGIGWHEARIPTIAGTVPRSAPAGYRRASGGDGLPELPRIESTRRRASGAARQQGMPTFSMARPLLADRTCRARLPRREPDQHGRAAGLLDRSSKTSGDLLSNPLATRDGTDRCTAIKLYRYRGGYRARSHCHHARPSAVIASRSSNVRTRSAGGFATRVKCR
jgi:2,4-dienoyl-CoA reductase (NADPH2)